MVDHIIPPTRGGHSVPHDVEEFVLHHESSFIAGWLAVSGEARGLWLRNRKLHTCACAALMLSLVANFYQASLGRPERLVASAADDQGSLMQLASISRPINTLPEVQRWVTNATAEAFTLDFSQLDEDFARARPNFTDAGWRGFQAALKSSGILDQITDNKYQVTTVPADVAVQATLPVAHQTSWTFQLPIISTYVVGSKSLSKTITIEVTIVQQNPHIAPRGLGIDSIKVE